MTLTAHRTALLNRPESVQLNDLHISVPESLEAHVEIWNRDFLQSMRDLVADAPEPDVYFYHSDHLGSASWITDKDGTPVQHLQYLPYGEPYINQRTTGYNERFTFTGKERDEETGYSYFGARYMDHGLMTMWLSVDPLADKYPSLSPYNYCAWNPVKLVDPDGQEVEYSSFQDRCFVLAARILSKGFRMRYNDLKDSKEVYVFNYNDKGDNKLSTDGNKLYINYSLGEAEKKERATVISLLRHETEHAVQFEYGEVGFQKDENGRWRTLNFDINDEIKARDFEASSSIILNSRSIHSIWGRKDERLETREQQIDYLRGAGYKAPDAVMNNTSADVGKDGTKFALQHRKRTY